jgi:cytosine deaminase
MCTGAILLYRIPEVVIGEDVSFKGEAEFLASRGVKVSVVNAPELIAMMKDFIVKNPALWNEDISEK